MSLKQIYRPDMLNRFTGYSFTETAQGDLWLVEFKDGSGTAVDAALKGSLDDCYTRIRQNLVGGADILPRLTTIQRNNITEPADGLLIFNLDNSHIERNDKGVWQQPAGATVPRPFGSLYVTSASASDSSTGTSDFVNLFGNSDIDLATTLVDFVVDNGNKRIVYKGHNLIKFVATAALTITGSGILDFTSVFRLTKNGIPVVPSIQQRDADITSAGSNVTLQAALELQKNDYVELEVARSPSGTVTPDYCSMNLS